jgi:hypothetical protein
MSCNTKEVRLPLGNGQFASIGDTIVSCRTACDWYVAFSDRKMTCVADHLPTYESAMKAQEEFHRNPYDPRITQ